MEKPLKEHISYKGVSKLENALIEYISNAGLLVFGLGEARRVSGFSLASANNVLNSLVKKGLVARLFRNKYCLAESLPENAFAIATSAFVPSYVSFLSALSFYGFTEQQPKIVQIASTKQFKKILLKNFSIQVVTTKPKNFFGYVQTGSSVIASKEKVLIDSASHLEQVLGFEEFVKCFKNAWNELNRKQFFEFLFKTRNKSLNSRIGYLIETLNLKTEKIFLKKLERNCSKSFIKLNYLGKKSNNYNKKWKIIVNNSIENEAIL